MPTVKTEYRTSETTGWLTFRAFATVGCLTGVAAVVGWSTWAGVSEIFLAAASSGMLLIVMWGRPRLAFVVWMLSLTMMPVWVSLHLVATVPAHCIVALLAVAANINRRALKMTRFDAYFSLFVGVTFAAVLLADSTWASWSAIVFRWAVTYLAARVLLSSTGTSFAVDVIAVVFGLVGALAVLELFLVWHPFTGWNTGTLEFTIWHPIQVRNGGDRSEWAFGHSIALGGSLALSIPFIVRSSYGSLARVALLIAVVAGIATTGSRGAVIAAALTAIICLAYSTNSRVWRTSAIVLCIPALALVANFLAPIFQDWARGGSGEEQVSFDYRNYLYSTYVPRFEWFGRSPLYDISGGKLSIDSEIVNLGLAFGWIVLVGAMIPLTISTYRIINGRATTAEISIVGQIPLFITVGFITQYESLIFLIVGIGVQMILVREGTNHSDVFPAGSNSSPRGSRASSIPILDRFATKAPTVSRSSLTQISPYRK